MTLKVERMSKEFRTLFALKRRLERDEWGQGDPALWRKYMEQGAGYTKVVLGRFAAPQGAAEGELVAWIGRPDPRRTRRQPDYIERLAAVPRHPEVGPAMARILDDVLRLMVRSFSKGCVAVDVRDGQIEPVALDSDGEIILELARMLRRSGPGACQFCGRSLPAGSRLTRRYCDQTCQKKAKRRRDAVAIEAGSRGTRRMEE
jgi:hypothetical protein